MKQLTAVLSEICQKTPVHLPRLEENEIHLIIDNDEDLLTLCHWIKGENYYLCTIVANDERLLESNVFKLYYVFSTPDNVLVICEYPLNRQQPRQFMSIREIYPSAIPLEREIQDLLGITPIDQSLYPNGYILHNAFPTNLYPLRRTRPNDVLEIRQKMLPKKEFVPSTPLPEGLMILPVGPIHADIIEAGYFPFLVAGEIVEDVQPRLGYKHRGIEKMMETKFSLLTGWQLAEKVSGDTSFGHSLAYCHAVESLANIIVPETAVLWRTVFLEMERIYNHIADVGALMHDIALDLVASEIALLREAVVQLNKKMTGNRLMRGVNLAGGIDLSPVPDIDPIRETLTLITDRFMQLGNLILELQHCRDRTIGIGVLTRAEIDEIGATGMPARASGKLEQDFRLRHPQGAYKRPFLQELIQQTITSDLELDQDKKTRQTLVYDTDLRGDVFARMALRITEIETSVAIILYTLQTIEQDKSGLLKNSDIASALMKTPNYEFSLGYAEGWRGDIFYWLMKGSNNTIFRCKVRDPSLFNWPALRLATICKPNEQEQESRLENILADFPIINKSFNLSYAGQDL